MIMRQRTNRDAILRSLPTDIYNAIGLADLAKILNATEGNVRYYLVKMQAEGLVEQLANRRWIATTLESPEDEEIDVVMVETEPSVRPEFGVSTAPDGNMFVQDISSLDIPQTLMEIVKHITHLAVLFSKIDADVNEVVEETLTREATEEIPVEECKIDADVCEAVEESLEQTVTAEEQQCCGTEVCCDDESSALDELIADMEIKQPEVTILRDLVYDPNNYRDILGRLWSSNIYMKNIIVLYEEVDNRKFTKGDVKYLFSILYNEYANTQTDDRKTKLMKRQISAVKNMADLHLSFLCKTECISLDKDGFYKFNVSPVDFFEISMMRVA
jgi:hypothetical protein